MGRDRLVEVVSAERGIAVGREHLENTARELEDGDVERAAAQVENGEGPFGGVVEPIGDRGRGRLVQEPQDVQSREPCRVLGRLALRVVEICRHRDHGAEELAPERLLGTVAQHAQDLGRDLHRGARSGRSLDGDHSGRVGEPVGQRAVLGDIGDATTHEALHRHDGVGRIVRLRGAGSMAHLDAPVGKVTHDRGQQRPVLGVGDDFGDPAPHRGRERMRRSQVDADGQLSLVRLGRFPRLGDLQQRHR